MFGFSQQRNKKRARKLLEKALMFANLVNTSVDPNTFFTSMKNVLDTLEELMPYEKYNFFEASLPSADFKKIVSNVDASFDNLIDRALDSIEKSPMCSIFPQEIKKEKIDLLLNMLSEMSSDRAIWQSRIDPKKEPIKLYSAANKMRVKSLYNNLCKTEENSYLQSMPSSWDYIDSMDGSAFEAWCADLLRKIGFSNVRLTGKSGDQGVDILADKQDVKFAIQCKCYHSDLGNTPVQEVYAGKMFYNCHIGAVMTNRYFTAGGKQLASSTGVLLWDRNWIQNYLQEIGLDIKESKVQTARWCDDMLPAAVDVILETGTASVSMLQHRLKLGYARAARIIDEMEEHGIVGPFRGSKPRLILISMEEWEEIKNQ